MIRVLFVSGCWKLSSELLCCWSWFKLVGSATRLLVITWYWLIDMEFVVCYGCLFCLSASFDCSASSYFHSDLVFRCLRFTKWRSRGGGGGGNKEGGGQKEKEKGKKNDPGSYRTWNDLLTGGFMWCDFGDIWAVCYVRVCVFVFVCLGPLFDWWKLFDLNGCC